MLALSKIPAKYNIDNLSSDIQEAIGRALDNMGRVYARKGEFAKAIDL